MQTNNLQQINNNSNINITKSLKLALTITKKEAEEYVKKHCCSIGFFTIFGTYQCLTNDYGKVFNKLKHCGIIIKDKNEELWFPFGGFIFKDTQTSPAIINTTKNIEVVQKF